MKSASAATSARPPLALVPSRLPSISSSISPSHWLIFARASTPRPGSVCSRWSNSASMRMPSAGRTGVSRSISSGAQPERPLPSRCAQRSSHSPAAAVE